MVQIGVASVVGVLAGIYIWQPLLVEYKLSNSTTKTQERNECNKIIITSSGWTLLCYCF